MFKKYGLFFSAILLAVLLVGLQSFTGKQNNYKTSTTNKWYTFDQGSTHSGENSASNYTLLQGQDPESVDCPNGEFVCLILAPEGANAEPDLPGMTDVFSDSRVEQIIQRD